MTDLPRVIETIDQRIDRAIAPLVKRIEALEGGASEPPSNQAVADALKLLSDLFSETAHETWTKEEIVNIIEDAIRLGTGGHVESPRGQT
jgi:hypothetical protein